MNRNPPDAPRSIPRRFIAMLVATTACVVASTAYGDEDKSGNDGAWKKRIHEVYRLDDGETVKFIPAPFIPERRNYLRRFHSNPPAGDWGQFTFAWDDKKQGDARLNFHSLSGGHGKVLSGFPDCGELSSTDYEYRGDVKEIDAAVHGDWIFRKSASREDRMKAVEEVIRKHVKVPVRAEKKKDVREVLVARGKLAHKKLKGTRNDDAIHFYTNELDREEGGGGGSATLSKLLVRLGEYTHYRVIDETQSSNEKVVWVNHMSAQTRRQPNWLDQMLKNLQDQTGLEFKFEKRDIELWVIRVGKAAEGKDPPQEGL